MMAKDDILGLTKGLTALYRKAMFFAWIIALVVPVLAVLGWPWVMTQQDPAAAGAFDDPMLLLVQFFLAAAPLVALAIFALANRAVTGAVKVAAVIAALLTLGIWGWYHAGGMGLPDGASGLALLASPVAIGVVALVIYWMGARRSV